MTRRTTTVMMRIAIAGAGGFASFLADQLSQGANSVLVLSTREHPEFASIDCQVAVVDYTSLQNLQFTLQGVDLVISTISGAEQLNLIDAARRARVRCFVPSEFEGALNHRPQPGDDPFDNDNSTALEQLRHWSTSRQHPMKYTVFSCGVFYERFAPGGLQQYNMGATSRLEQPGSYMIDVGTGNAELPASSPQGRSVQLVMTSAVDVARFVAAAVDLGIENWPRELKMRGTRMTPQSLEALCSQVRGVQFSTITRPFPELMSWVQYYEQNRDEARWYTMQHLAQTAMGRYDFRDANLNDMVDVQPIAFETWLFNHWGSAQ
ncbi:NAD(P)-binding protein [Xylariomycetidae sp. FL2044]|nr:NAD(P)-binding protein [Xylariomycetidae sp. FL2044]